MVKAKSLKSNREYKTQNVILFPLSDNLSESGIEWAFLFFHKWDIWLFIAYFFWDKAVEDDDDFDFGLSYCKPSAVRVSDDISTWFGPCETDIKQ